MQAMFLAKLTIIFAPEDKHSVCQLSYIWKPKQMNIFVTGILTIITIQYLFVFSVFR